MLLFPAKCCNPSCVLHLLSLASFLPDLQNKIHHSVQDLIPPSPTFSGSASLSSFSLHQGTSYKSSTGKYLALQPSCWQSLTSPVYLESFLSKASSRRSSHGTVSSSSTACLVDSDTKIMSRHRVVTAIWLVNFSWCSRSTSNCQLQTSGTWIPADDVLQAVVVVSQLWQRRWFSYWGGENYLDQTGPVLMASAMVFRTWSYLHLYHTSPNALLQQQRMCSRVPRLEDNEHAGVC